MKAKILLILSLLFIPVNICAEQVCTIIENKMGYEIPVSSPTGLTQDQFNGILAEFFTIYDPIVKSHGYTLVLKNKWKDATVNSDTTVSGSNWVINAYGGLARYSIMTPDAYMMVLCHEMGHHLGGYPNMGWASNEGQSDYYATAKCFPRTSYGKKNSFRMVPAVVTEHCQLQHMSSTDINTCINSAMTGLTLASVLRGLGNTPSSIDFTTPDPTQVSTTDNSHPNAQCRLDTYFSGAVCGKQYTQDFSTTSPIQGACAEEAGDKIGVRPRCWYKPQY